MLRIQNKKWNIKDVAFGKEMDTKTFKGAAKAGADKVAVVGEEISIGKE